jgi:formylglycine-generating enzyme required for sulfatase activity
MLDVSALLPRFCSVPAQPFLMGTTERELSPLARLYGGTRESYREETPQTQLTLPAFEMAQLPVTNDLYAYFVAQTGARAPIVWRASQPSAALARLPVVDVSWHEAQQFCAWLSEVSGEHAARGSDARRFPWGETFDPHLANTRESAKGLVSVDEAETDGASPYGLLMMSGTVWEWTSSLDVPYPYDAHDGREDPEAPGRRILRGGCYANPHGYARCACRFRLLPTMHNEFLGFRLVRSEERA